MSENEKAAGLEIVSEIYNDTGLLPLIIKLQAKILPFRATMFEEDVSNNVTCVEWWKTQKDFSEISSVTNDNSLYNKRCLFSFR